MTPDQFNDALARCIEAEANKQSPCYPLVGLGGDANDFRAWDNERQVVLCGVYCEDAITPNLTDRAIGAAVKLMMEDDRVIVVPCVLITEDTTPMIVPDSVLVYFVGLNSEGVLVFTDFENLNWDSDGEDERYDDWD